MTKSIVHKCLIKKHPTLPHHYIPVFLFILNIDSTHIRIIAFSPSPIDRCSIRINDQNWQTCTQVNKQLFVVKWNPETYRKGVHKIEVLVRDVHGRQRLVHNTFN